VRVAAQPRKLFGAMAVSLTQKTYGTYKPIREELRKYWRKPGLDEEEMKRASETGT